MADTDDTAPVQRGVPFKPGQSGNPSGRPKGARSKLGESILDKVNDIWQRRGDEMLEKSVTAEPMQFCKMVKDLLPREFLVKATMQHNVSVFADYDLQDARQFAEAWRIARSTIGAEPPMIDLQADMEHDLRDSESFADDD